MMVQINNVRPLVKCKKLLKIYLIKCKVMFVGFYYFQNSLLRCKIVLFKLFSILITKLKRKFKLDDFLLNKNKNKLDKKLRR